MMPRKKKWYFYDVETRTPAQSLWTRAISEISLPRNTSEYECAFSCPIPVMRVGATADLIFGDPRLLRECTLVEKGISGMPEEMKNQLRGPENWWTLRWKGKTIFVSYLHIALAKDAKIKKA